MNKLTLAVTMLVLLSAPTGAQNPGVPVIKITQEDSSIKFAVKAFVSIDGTFDKGDATMTFSSTDAEAGVLEIKIQAGQAGQWPSTGLQAIGEHKNQGPPTRILFRRSSVRMCHPETVIDHGPMHSHTGSSRDRNWRSKMSNLEKLNWKAKNCRRI